MAASTPRKTTTARKAAPRRRAPAKQSADLGLVLDDAAARSEIDRLIADREPLFTIGDTTYTIPKKVPPSWTMKAYRLAVEKGESAALQFAVEKMLTVEAYDALTECESVTETGMTTIINALINKVLPDGVLGPKA